MTKDVSDFCPGGTGKKIKHCMCRDISSDLTKVMRALAGNQRVAAVEQINRLLATNANRPCLLSLKSLTLLEMNDLQNLEETVATFVKVAPDNALAHTFAALLEVRKNHPKTAVDALQAAIENAGKFFPGELYDAIGAVAETLAKDGQYVAARGHLLFRAMVGDQEEDALQPLLSISSTGNIPLLLKRDFIFTDAPADVSWSRPFAAAAAQCARGAWKSALEAFEKLEQEYPGEAQIRHNIATARGYLGYVGSAEAWHNYAMLDSVDFEDAVKAEATSQLLEHDVTRKMVGIVKLILDVRDDNALQEKLLSSNQIILDSRDLSEMRQEGAPPPKALYLLVDRPAVAKDAELTLETVPRLLCQLVLYGKETDREARLEVIVAKGDQFDATSELIAELTGELVAHEPESEEVLDTMPLDAVELFPNLRFPDETSLSDRKRLVNEAVSATFAERWSQLPSGVLDNKTPQEVAQDPAYRVRLAAALLALEQLAEINSWPVDVDQLREALGVGVPAAIDPTDFDLTTLEPQDWHRVDAEKLGDDQLRRLYSQAALYSARRAIQRLGAEVLHRGKPGDGLDLAAVAGGMAQLADDPDVALKLLARARQLSKEAGTSPARWYLSELPLRLVRGDTAEVQHIMTVLQSQHIREPGVSEALYNILVKFGIITRDGRIAGEAAQAGPAPTAPPAEGGQQIWTPDSAPSATGPQKESKLWVPGMD